MTNTKFTIALCEEWLNYAAQKVSEKRKLAIDGRPYDSGFEDDDSILRGLEVFIERENPNISKEEIAIIKSELAEVWIRYKGYFEPVRWDSLQHEMNYSYPIKHWTMLVLAFPCFKRVAEVIGEFPNRRFTEKDILDVIGNDYEKDEIQACLEQMTIFEAIIFVNGVYIKQRLFAENPDVKNAAAEYLETVINGFIFLNYNKGYRALKYEYEVKVDSKEFNFYFPFRALYKEFSRFRRNFVV